MTNKNYRQINNIIAKKYVTKDCFIDKKTVEEYIGIDSISNTEYKDYLFTACEYIENIIGEQIMPIEVIENIKNCDYNKVTLSYNPILNVNYVKVKSGNKYIDISKKYYCYDKAFLDLKLYYNEIEICYIAGLENISHSIKYVILDVIVSLYNQELLFSSLSEKNITALRKFRI
jgi:hypothetical protein